MTGHDAYLQVGDVVSDNWTCAAHTVGAVTTRYAITRCGKVLWVELGVADTRLASPDDVRCRACVRLVAS